jgi:hypothetical protein
MNFQDLLTKMKQLDEAEIADHGNDNISTPSETDLEECGMEIMPAPHMSAPKQSDSVTMNVSMNGSGAGGIRDLLNVLKDIQDGPEHEPQHGHSGETDILIGEPEEESYEEDVNDGGFGSSTTSPDQTTLNVSSVIPTGDDLHSKGSEAEKVNGGGNPFNVSETLLAQLSRHYESIKEGKKDDFDALKHVKNPTKGEKEAAKDVKRGSYADRAAMLKSAEKEGRLKD